MKKMLISLCLSLGVSTVFAGGDQTTQAHHSSVPIRITLDPARYPDIASTSSKGIHRCVPSLFLYALAMLPAPREGTEYTGTLQKLYTIKKDLDQLHSTSNLEHFWFKIRHCKTDNEITAKMRELFYPDSCIEERDNRIIATSLFKHLNDNSFNRDTLLVAARF